MKTLPLHAHLAVLPLALLGTFSFSTLKAQTALKETVVTATRAATRADELVSEVVVIDRAALDRSVGRTLPELLAREAGLQMSSNGGLGKTSSVFIRGTESRHTILLIDGVRYGSATAGIPAWDNIPLDAIERIEVLKGPASALYGSDAVGGVVQIFMRKGVQGFQPGASVTVGSNAFRQAAASLRGAQGDVDYALGLQVTRDGGFSSTNPAVAFGNYNADLDPFRQDAINASVGWRFAPDWKLSANLLNSSGVSQYDDGPGRDARSKLGSSSLGVNLRGVAAKGWTTQLSFGQSTDKNNAEVAAFLPSQFETRQNQLGWQNDIDTPIGVVLAGLEQLKQSVTSSTVYTVMDRTVNSAYLGLNGSSGAHSWQLNVRRDSNSQFGVSSTGFAGYGFQIAPQWRARIAHGTSFVAPSFNQLYFPAFGNPALQPEKGRNTELGLDWTLGAHKAKLIRFDNRIQGFITSATLPANIPQARIDGWTLGYEGAFDALTVRASADTLNPRNLLTDKLLPRRAKQQLSLGLDYTTGPWRLGGNWLSVGQRYDNVTNTAPLAAYSTLDVTTDYQVTRDWAVQGRVRNLTNKTYETAAGYNQPGRGRFVSLRWAPK